MLEMRGPKGPGISSCTINENTRLLLMKGTFVSKFVVTVNHVQCMATDTMSAALRNLVLPATA